MERNVRNVVSQLRKLFDNKSTFELEIRYIPLTKNKFYKLISKLRQSKFEEEISYTVDEISSNEVRKTYYLDSLDFSNYKSKKSYKIIKRRQLKYDLSEKSKIILSTENSTDIEPDVIELIRYKERFTFKGKLSNGIKYNIDVTKTNENSEERYELEVEINSNDFFTADTSSQISTIISLDKSMANVLDNGDETYVDFYNKIISNNEFKSNNISSWVPRARDLSLLDITKDGLLSGYMASIKVDGVQRILIFHDKGVYSVYPGTESFRIADLDERFIETIIVGEELILKERKYYIPFDVICFNGVSLMNEKYEARLKYLEKMENVKLLDQGVEILTFMMKTFHHINQYNFYEINKKILDSEYEYPTDGIIYTPNKGGYFPEGFQTNSKRVLSELTDIVKYKTVENLTIDFLYRKGELYVTDDKNLVVFRGSNRYPFNVKFSGLTEEKVYEFEPVFSGSSINFKVRREREDKKFPNTVEIAKNLWNMLHDPITYETMTGGSSTQLLRRYHNTIKKDLFRDMKGLCVDIGSGAGGDLSKWENFDKILAVEPSSENISQFNERIEKMQHIKNKIKLVKAGGEDTLTILNSLNFFTSFDKPMYVTMMLSLTFFNKQLIQDLANTINKIKDYYTKNGGKHFYFVYFTMYEPNIKSIKLGAVNIEKIDSETIKINISDSNLVFNQIEYVPDLKLLWELTSLTPMYEKRADPKLTNFFMSEDENKFSKMFVYGKAHEGEALVPHIVSTTHGIKFQNRIIAKGDDHITQLKTTFNNTYRVSVIDNSFIHSFLKLTEKEYRKADHFERVRLANKIEFKDISSFSKEHSVRIMLWDSKKWKVISEEFSKTILMVEFKDNKYEPIIIIDKNQYHYIFNLNVV